MDYTSESFEKLLLQAAQRAEKSNIRSLSDLYSLLRQQYLTDGNRPKTLEYALKQYKVLSRRGDSGELLWIIVDIGNIFFDAFEFDKALEFYKKAEIIALKKNETHALSVIYLNFGLIANEKAKYADALKYYNKSIYYRVREGNVKFAASTYERIARTFISMKEADSAKKYIQLTEEYYYNKGQDDAMLAEMPALIEMVWFHYYGLVKNHEQAVQHLAKAKEYSLKHNFTYEYYYTFFYEAKYYSDRKEYNKAIECLLYVVPFFQKHKLLMEEKYSCKMLGKMYSRLQQYEKSNEYYHRYIELDDNIEKSEMTSQLDIMRTIAAVYESDATLERTKKKLDLAKVNNKLRVRERNTSIWIAVCALAGILILLRLMVNLKNNKKELLGLHRRLTDQHKEIKINSLELQRSNQIKDKLFSIIAHDIRNPLNRLLGELAVVKKAIRDKQLTDPMEKTLKQTINLFEGLLQWSKLDNKQNIYSPAKVNLNENINKIILFYLPEIQTRDIHVINNSSTIPAYADQNILQTLLRNLLSNAITSLAKSTDKKIIEIETRQPEDGSIEIIFSDSGPGFPAEIMYDFDNDIPSGSPKERGLGLSICKVLVKMSGWKMSIGNHSKHHGAQIVIKIPAYRGATQIIQNIPLLPDLLPASWKSRLRPLQEYKYYQVSEIRKFIKSVGETDDILISNWLRQVQLSVHEGDKETFSRLMAQLD